MPDPKCLIAANVLLARAPARVDSAPARSKPDLCLWQQVAANGPGFRAIRNFHGEEASDPATRARNVIFARRHGIVRADAAIDAAVRIPRQRVKLGNRTAEWLAAGNGANAVVLEDVPAKGLAVVVPARVVNHLETNNDHSGRTRACMHAAPLR